MSLSLPVFFLYIFPSLFVLAVDWAADIPCEEPKGKKRLKLPIMGTPSRVYPDYSEILAAQLRDANFGPSANMDGTGSAVADTSIDRAPAPVIVTVDSGVEGPVDVRPPKKKRKRTKSSKEVTADPPLDGDETEAAQTQLEPMGGDEVEEGDEVAPIEGFTGPPGDESSGGEAREPGEVTRPIDGGMQTTLSVSEFAFADKFAESLCADAEVDIRLRDCV